MTAAVAPMAPVAALAGPEVGMDDKPITTELDGGRVLKIGFVALVLAAGLFFIGGGSVLALVYAAHQKRNAVANAKPDNSAPDQPKSSANPDSSPSTPPPIDQKPFRPGVNDPDEKDPKNPGEIEPVAAPRLPPDEQAKVNKAIEKGLAYVKKLPTNLGNGGDANGSHGVGLVALQGLTLLECGVKADDATMQAITKYIRSEIPLIIRTYNISLALLYLDRLGDPADRKLIQSLALRLVAGQRHDGGWTYFCDAKLTPAEEQELLTILEQTRPRNPLELFVDDKGKVSPEFVVPRPGEKLPEFVVPGKGTDDPDGPSNKNSTSDGGNGSRNDPPKDIKKVLEKASPKFKNLPGLQPPGQTQFNSAGSDNSNTQFAILAVWVASRHDVPVERTLALLVKRFRTSQDKQGHWGYQYQRSPQFAGGETAMTCAGLLGLGAGYGLTSDPADKAAKKPPVQDKMVQDAFKALEKAIDKPIGLNAKNRPRVAQPLNLYFLWSLERVGVMYNVTNIGDKDWYRWGAELILDHQQPNGSWTNGGYPGANGTETPRVDTCFALLFLKRANLAKDLSKKLEFIIDVKDLGNK